MKTIHFKIHATDAQVPSIKSFLESILAQLSDTEDSDVQVIDEKTMFFRMNKTSKEFANALREHYGLIEIPMNDATLNELRIKYGIINYHSLISTLEGRGGIIATYAETATGRRKVKSFRFTF